MDVGWRSNWWLSFGQIFLYPKERSESPKPYLEILESNETFQAFNLCRWWFPSLSSLTRAWALDMNQNFGSMISRFHLSILSRTIGVVWKFLTWVLRWEKITRIGHMMEKIQARKEWALRRGTHALRRGARSYRGGSFRLKIPYIFVHL